VKLLVLLGYDEPGFNSDVGDGNSGGDVGLRRALDALVGARDGEETALAAGRLVEVRRRTKQGRY